MKFSKRMSLKSDNEIRKELVGSYGSTLVIMSSNPNELNILYDKLKSDYSVVMDTTLLENHDYGLVVIRKDINGDN